MSSWLRVNRLFADSRFRRQCYESQLAGDRLGLHAAAILLLVIVIGKTLLQEGLPWLALRGGSHSIVAGGLALLARRRPLVWVRYRELWFALVLFDVHVATLDGALHGGTNILERHRDSPLMLLALLLVYNCGFWMAITALFARVTFRANAAILPLSALFPLLASRRVCGRLFEAPGVAVPLNSLYGWLSFVHTAPLTIAPLSLLLESEESPHQCLVVSSWSLLLTGVLLPLHIIWNLERQALAAFEQRQRTTEGHAFLRPLQFFLSSCVLWATIDALVMPWQRRPM